MSEELVLVDPIQPPTPPAVHKYKVTALSFDREMIALLEKKEPGFVNIRLKDDIGGVLNCQYTGDEAIDLIKWMNTANFSNNSMQKRILQKLMADGKLPPGTVQGQPESSELDL